VSVTLNLNEENREFLESLEDIRTQCIVCGKNFSSWVHTVGRLELVLGVKAVPRDDCPKDLQWGAETTLAFVDLEKTIEPIGVQVEVDEDFLIIRLPEQEKAIPLDSRDWERQHNLAKALGFCNCSDDPATCQGGE